MQRQKVRALTLPDAQFACGQIKRSPSFVHIEDPGSLEMAGCLRASVTLSSVRFTEQGDAVGNAPLERQRKGFAVVIASVRLRDSSDLTVLSTPISNSPPRPKACFLCQKKGRRGHGQPPKPQPASVSFFIVVTFQWGGGKLIEKSVVNYSKKPLRGCSRLSEPSIATLSRQGERRVRWFLWSGRSRAFTPPHKPKASAALVCRRANSISV